jgi:hypothetical protein
VKSFLSQADPTKQIRYIIESSALIFTIEKKKKFKKKNPK